MALVGSYTHLEQDFRLVIGKTLRYRVTVRDTATPPAVVNLSGKVFEFGLEDSRSGSRVVKSSADGAITIIDAEGGVVEAVLSRSETGALGPGRYRHELALIEGGDAYPVSGGVATLLETALS